MCLIIIRIPSLLFGSWLNEGVNFVCKSHTHSCQEITLTHPLLNLMGLKRAIFAIKMPQESKQKSYYHAPWPRCTIRDVVASMYGSTDEGCGSLRKDKYANIDLDSSSMQRPPLVVVHYQDTPIETMWIKHGLA